MHAPAPEPRPASGHLRILIGLATGILLGLVVHAFKGPPGQETSLFQFTTALAEPIGRLFLRLMQMVVLPLVVSALYLAVVDVGDLRRLGRIGLTTLFFTAILSTSAVLIGVGLVNVVQPGQSLSAETRDRLTKAYADKAEESEKKAAAAKSFGRIIVDLLPENPIQEMTGALDGSSPGNGMLAVITFPLLFGVAAQMGFEILQALAVFVLVVIAGLLIQLLLVYSAVLRLFGGLNPLRFFRLIQEAMIVAFSTSSSSATLSTSMKVAQDKLRLAPETANFVLTVGATGNQNGTALFEGVVVLFLAQVFNVDLSFAQQFIVVLMAVLAGVGTAGVPGGSIPLIIVVLKTVNVPAEGIAIVLGVDRILDMSRTLVNVVGDLVVAQCVDARNQLK